VFSYGLVKLTRKPCWRRDGMIRPSDGLNILSEGLQYFVGAIAKQTLRRSVHLHGVFQQFHRSFYRYLAIEASV
jgi:hypothetical protein